MKHHFVKTENHARLTAAVRFMEERGSPSACLCLLHGAPGVGKTRNISHWGAGNGAVLIKGHVGMSLSGLRWAISEKLGVRHRNNGTAEIEEQIAALKEGAVPLVFDEAQFGLAMRQGSVRAAGIEYLRDIAERAGSYSITVDAGGASSRDDSVRASISSDFDASAWESAPRAAAISPIYAANDPHPPSGAPTGYEGLPEPNPPTNGGVDHFGDIATPDLQAAVSQVVARAMRRAAAGRRRRTVRFARPLDPRWEIGAVLAINAGGVSATGQVSEIEHEMNVDSGALSSTFTLAVPDGNGAATGYTATASVPANSVIHNLPDQHLTNWIGSSFETIPDPDPDTVQGFLCNVDPRSDNYDSEAPAYVTQFRLVMPDIAAPLRDPLTVETAITGAVTVSSGSLEINF